MRPDTRSLVEALEDGRLAAMDHADHVRVARHYPRRDDLATVLRELHRKLRRYAASKGAPEAYHETITFAFACLVHERVARSRCETWEAFAAEHAEPSDRSLRERDCSRERLDSPLARRVFVRPDLSGPREEA